MIREHLISSAQECGFEMDAALLDGMERFYSILKNANATSNLTRITDSRDAAYLHFMDSLAPLWLCPPLLSAGATLDLGAGAGFPGIPLALAMPGLNITMLDSVEKKVKFLCGAIDNLGLHSRAIHARAEHLAHDEEHREQYATALSRAVAPLPTLLELALPFVRVGGTLLAWKGPGADEELSLAKTALQALGGRVEDIVSYKLMRQSYERRIILITKIRQSSAKHPRKPDLPRKSPLF